MDTKILRSLSYGVYIVSSMDGERPCGCAANSIMQITSDPRTVAASINRANYTNELIKKTGRFAISILAEDSDPAIIGIFGFKSSKEYDKFDDFEHEMVDGLPIIKDSCGYMELKVIDSIETSTHTIFIGEMTEGAVFKGRTPMTYAYYHDVVKGKTGRNAPTYMPEIDSDKTSQSDEAASTTPSGKWVCKRCGYVYDGDVPFEELPESWSCPLCGVPKSSFEYRED